MNTQERIAILERLLERVKGKGSRPRAAAAAAPEPASAVMPASAASAESPAPPPTVASALPPAAAASPAPPTAASPAPPPTVASAAPAAPSAPPVAPSAPAPAYASVAAQRPPSEPASGEWATAAVSASVAGTYPMEPTGDFGGDDAVQELELSDEELVDITIEDGEAELPHPAVARAPSSGDVEIDIEEEEEEEEEAPASSRRARVAESMDEALASATDEPEPEREVPLKTPPPESGPQAALPLPSGLEQSPLPGEYDSGVHPAEEVKIDLPAAGPTHAQLGQTIDLEEPRGPDLELDMRSRVPAPPPEPGQDELEAALPDASVERMRPSPSSLPPQELSAPERTERARMHSDVAPASFSRAARPFTPNTFAELLDASLALSPE